MNFMVVSKYERHPEIDGLRGIAVILMVFYHILFDLDYFYRFDFPFEQLHWNIAAWSIASLFLLLVGIGFALSWERTTQKMRLRKIFKRSAFILSGAIIISIVTWFVAPDAFVKFGILHLIGVSVLLQPFFVCFKKWNLILGMIFVCAGLWTNTLTSSSVFLFAFGIAYPEFASLDYYPLLPWFGVILIGMGVGYLLYLPKRHESLAALSDLPHPHWLLWCGRRAFAIYILHQPIILLILWITIGRT